MKAMRLIACIATLAGCVEEEAGLPPITELPERGWEVTNVGAPLNSEAAEGFPTVAPDGLTMYFASSRDRHGTDEANWDIYVSTRESRGSAWTEPVRLENSINTIATEHSVTLSADGREMYFSSTRPGGCGDLDLYVSEREDVLDPTGWGEPRHLGCGGVNGPGADVCAIYHVEGAEEDVVLYFVSNREGGPGGFDIYRSYLDDSTGEFGPPSVIPVLSSAADDFHFDPVAGFVWTVRDGGLGSADIWFAPRGPNGEWLEPIHAGADLNTEFNEDLPSPLDGGRILFFPSNRPDGLGSSDLYQAVARNAG